MTLNAEASAAASDPSMSIAMTSGASLDAVFPRKLWSSSTARRYVANDIEGTCHTSRARCAGAAPCLRTDSAIEMALGASGSSSARGFESVVRPSESPMAR